MKDIDFDELDKAVSSLMGTVTNMPEPTKQDDIRTLTISETIKDDKAPILPVGEVKTEDVVAVAVKTSPKPEPETPKPVVPAPVRETAAVPTLAARRSGRFMDMVHPASAMKPAEARAVSRQGVTLAPLEPSVAADTVASTSVKPVVAATPVESDEVAVAVEVSETVTPVEVTIESSPWPDPIDLHEATSADEPTPDVAADEHESVATAPLTSPFLTDAKVEKRPLGVPTAAESAESLPPLAFDTEPSTEPVPVAAPADEPVNPPQHEVILPEELQSDLIAIEADQPTGAGAPRPDPVVPAASPAPVARSDAFTSMAATAASVAGGSIPQQYQEQPNSGDQTTGAIYDTAAYHQPLEHPAKKQASWLWIVWVAGLLVLGAGGGALVYNFLLK